MFLFRLSTCVLSSVLFLGGVSVAAQETDPVAKEESGKQEPPVASTSASPTSEVPQVPGISGLLRGLNGGISFSGLHDSQTGWATIMQPAIGYSFSNIFSFDITVPIYLFRLAPTRAISAPANQQLVIQRGEIGDVLFGLHAQFQPHGFDYLASVSGTAPTGDAYYGLTSGRPAFDFSNRLERTFKTITPNVEIGIGDSTTIVNQLVTRNYTSLGPLAHFQAGAAFPLAFPWIKGASFESDAYEQLPIGDQKIYDTIGRRGGAGPSRTVVTGRSVTEDNGFTNILDVPVDGHVTLSAYYNRSLRFHNDVVSFGVTYVLRSLHTAKASADDALLKSVEQEIQSTPKPAKP